MITHQDAAAHPRDNSHTHSDWGLTKRELMAAHICASLNANPNIGVTSFPLSEIAEMAVKQADELINALNQ